MPAGYFERSSLDGRSDVLTYTTSPLVTPLQVVGSAHLSLYCQADASSFDLSAILAEVYPDGRVINLTQGYKTLGGGSPGELLLLALDLHPTSFLLPKGHSLRLSLATTCFPAYPVNSGTGQPPVATETIDHRIITLAVWHGGGYPSSLELPCR
jgi:putative CocE/NonD family hydrolase